MTETTYNVNAAIQVHGDVPVKFVPKFDAGCPDCGDSIQTESVIVRDHGSRRRIQLAWCADCKKVHGNTIGELFP